MIYGVYLAYHKEDVLPDHISIGLPDYPKEIARVRAYDNKEDQLYCFAETRCPASQLIEAENESLFQLKIEEMANNFLNEEWLKIHIYPYC